MITDDEPILSDINFEALKGGYKQIATRDGDKVALTLFLDPQDVPAVLATAPLRTRFKVGMVELGDDERPINRRPASAANGVSLKDRSMASKERSKQHYATADPMEQARIDCVMRCKDHHFWQWLSEINDEPVQSEARARHYVHEELRAARYVDRDEVSRGDIAKNQKAYATWREMEAQYLTDTAHAPSRRREDDAYTYSGQATATAPTLS